MPRARAAVSGRAPPHAIGRSRGGAARVAAQACGGRRAVGTARMRAGRPHAAGPLTRGRRAGVARGQSATGFAVGAGVQAAVAPQRRLAAADRGSWCACRCSPARVTRDHEPRAGAQHALEAGAARVTSAACAPQRRAGQPMADAARRRSAAPRGARTVSSVMPRARARSAGRGSAPAATGASASARRVRGQPARASTDAAGGAGQAPAAARRGITGRGAGRDRRGRRRRRGTALAFVQALVPAVAVADRTAARAAACRGRRDVTVYEVACAPSIEPAAATVESVSQRSQLPGRGRPSACPSTARRRRPAVAPT